MNNFIITLGVMSKGMLGIFISTVIIILFISVLNKFTKANDDADID